MTRQVALRLPEETVAFVDEIVASGEARSRAAVVTSALDRERRRRLALRDAEIYATAEPDPDLEAFNDYATRDHPPLD